MKAQTFRSTLHRTTDALILELEPQPLFEKTQAIQFYGRLQTAVLSLRNASLSDLAQTLAREVRALTGFDRVMVYRFEADEHGVVIAEAKDSHLKNYLGLHLESYLGLHYPANDSPAPARKLFLGNWVRQIPDINCTHARLISLNDASNEPPLDLSDCVLRGVSPCHVEYLQNMGVVGSLTISLIDDQRLWGLIACHHYSPRLVDYETRKICEFLGQFAHLMGGDITVQSLVNQGSTFTCKVLLQQPEAMVAEPEPTYRAIGLQPGQPTYRILVVEDVLENQQLLRTLLEPIGFAVHTVENGVEAIAQWQPHLILMDIQMPIMNGYEATRQIRLNDQKQVDGGASGGTKIIALTASAFREDRTASLQAGCDDYVAKPFAEAALFEVIARHLGVQYCYATQASSEPATSERKPLTTQDLHKMSLEWSTQVHEASLDLNDTKIRHLMTQIPLQEQTLTEGMTFLVDNFQLEASATLTQL